MAILLKEMNAGTQHLLAHYWRLANSIKQLMSIVVSRLLTNL